MSDKQASSNAFNPGLRPVSYNSLSPTQVAFGGGQASAVTPVPVSQNKQPRVTARPLPPITSPQPASGMPVPSGASTDRPDGLHDVSQTGRVAQPGRVASLGKAIENKLIMISPHEKSGVRRDDEKSPSRSASGSLGMRPSSASSRSSSATGMDLPRGTSTPASPPPTYPAPPPDLPPLLPNPFLEDLVLSATTAPRYVTAPGADPGQIEKIAQNFVQAYVDDGLDIKSIGRGNAAPTGGDKAFREMSRFFNVQLQSSGLHAVVQASKAAIEDAYGDRPEDLQSKKSDDADKEGHKVEVDLILIEPYTRPILTFVAGPNQLPSESALTPGVLSMINSIDAKLLEALLAHRDNQLAAAALQRDEPDPESRRAEIVKYGWDAKKFDKLIRQGVYSAKDIEKARLNLILNLVCTRCVTPYIMFAGQQITQDGSSGQKPITATTKLLSAGVNRLFNKNYDRFCKALMAATDMGLSTKTAQALEALRPESRFDSVKHSRQLPSNSDKTYRPKRARQSMPNLAQGGEFQAQMHKEKEAHESALQSERQADYKDNRDAEIDKFKLAHASDFAEFNFALVFNRLLRAWKHENGEAALGKIAAAMQLLHAQATDVLEDDTAELMEASDKQPPSKRTAHAREVPSTEKKRRESTSTDEASAFGLAQLPEGRRTTLTDFLKTPAYKTSFERYPQLRQIIEEVAVEWVKDGTDGSFSLYLKKAYETELRRCVRLSERAFGRGTKITNDELKKAVGVWRDRPENLGKMMLLDDLQKIMPGSVNVLHLPRMKESSLTRNAEAITEQFLQRADVKAELRNNKPLKQAFLNDIADWLHLGAYSQDPMAVVQRQYNDALLKQYRQGLAAGGTDRNLSDRLRAVAEGLLQNQEGMVLSTRSLDQLLAQLDAAWQ